MSLTLFANKKDLEAAQSKIESLEGEVSELQASLQIAQTEASAHAETIASLQAQVAEISAERDECKASAEIANGEIEALQAKLTEAEASAESKAVALVAQSGAEAPLPIEGNASKTLREQYESISNPSERAEFRAKHWDQLIKKD
jgi:chromosome segregation ATPase